MPAYQAQPEMDPIISDLDAVFANVRLRAGELDLTEMGAAIRHAVSLRPGRFFQRLPVPISQDRCRFISALQEFQQCVAG